MSTHQRRLAILRAARAKIPEKEISVRRLAFAVVPDFGCGEVQAQVFISSLKPAIKKELRLKERFGVIEARMAVLRAVRDTIPETRRTVEAIAKAAADKLGMSYEETLSYIISMRKKRRIELGVGHTILRTRRIRVLRKVREKIPGHVSERRFARIAAPELTMTESEAYDFIRRLPREFKDELFNNIRVFDEKNMRDAVPFLRRLAYSITKNRETAEDVVQDTLVRALSNIHSFRVGTNMKAWLSRILRNMIKERALLQRRRSTHELHYFEKYVEPRSRALPEQEAALEISDVFSSMKDLDPRLRKTLAHAIQSDFDYSATALLSTCPVGTVKSRLNRARKDLMSRLGMESEHDIGPESRIKAAISTKVLEPV